MGGVLNRSEEEKDDSSDDGSFIHYPEAIGNKNQRKHCVVCYKKEQKQVKTYYKCHECQVSLCIDKLCFMKYHNNMSNYTN